MLKADQLHLLSQMVALAVADCIRVWSGDIPVRIKWPNDVFLGKKKVAGILIENGLNQDGLVAYSVIGIGINVGQKCLPPELPHATSLYLQTGQEIPIMAVYEQLCRCLNQRYPQLHGLHFEQVRTEYQSRMFGLGSVAQFETQHAELVRAEILGIDDKNNLLIRQNDDIVTAWGHGSISMRL